ncbi:MAG: MBL fold metallo-hydrolase [Candidatus Binataceae bacterium]
MMAVAMNSTRAQSTGKPVSVLMLGTGDAFASGGRSHSAYLIEAGAKRVLMEAGPDVLGSLKRERIAPESIGLVLISHLHGDHFAGLGFLLLEYAFESRRRTTLTIAGPRNLESRTRAVVRAMYPGFPWDRVQSGLKWAVLEPARSSRLHGIQVDAIRSPHTAPDVSLSLRIKVAGKTIVFTGDTAWNEELVALCDGADLFLSECTLFDRNRGFKHMQYTELAARRHRFKVQRIVLTHLGSEVLAHEGEVAIEMAYDGMRIEL